MFVYNLRNLRNLKNLFKVDLGERLIVFCLLLESDIYIDFLNQYASA